MLLSGLNMRTFALSYCFVVFGCCLFETCCFLQANGGRVDLEGGGRSGGKGNCHQDVFYQRRIHFQFKIRLLCVSDYSNCFGEKLSFSNVTENLYSL